MTVTRGLKLAALQITDRGIDPIDAAIDAACRLVSNGPRYVMYADRPGRFRWRWRTWSWRVVDEAVSPHKVHATGRALTKKAATRRRYRAYLRVLDGGAR